MFSLFARLLKFQDLWREFRVNIVVTGRRSGHGSCPPFQVGGHPAHNLPGPSAKGTKWFDCGKWDFRPMSRHRQLRMPARRLVKQNLQRCARGGCPSRCWQTAGVSPMPWTSGSSKACGPLLEQEVAPNSGPRSEPPALVDSSTSLPHRQFRAAHGAVRGGGQCEGVVPPALGDGDRPSGLPLKRQPVPRRRRRLESS